MTEPPSKPAAATPGPKPGNKSGPKGATETLCRAVSLVVRHARLVLLAALILSGFSAWAVSTLGVNTDTTGLISKDLPFRKTFAEYRRNFPWFKATLVVVIDGESVDAADDASNRLFARMAAHRSRFVSLYFPRGEPFFRRNGLLYQSVKKLEMFSDRVAAAQPFLAELTKDPSLRGLFDILRLAVGRLGTADGKPDQLAPVLDRISKVCSLAKM